MKYPAPHYELLPAYLDILAASFGTPHAEIELEEASNLSLIAVFTYDARDYIKPGFHQNDPAGTEERWGHYLDEVWLAEPVERKKVEEILNAHATESHYIDGGIEKNFYIKAGGCWHRLLHEITQHLSSSHIEELQRLEDHPNADE